MVKTYSTKSQLSRNPIQLASEPKHTSGIDRVTPMSGARCGDQTHNHCEKPLLQKDSLTVSMHEVEKHPSWDAPPSV